jgi:energy-coupling factor transporter ATP-binding protein EcfA2
VIKTFRAKSYGCLHDVKATLTPLHAFIGPNDSGKSTLLRAVRTLMAASTPTPQLFSVDLLGDDGALQVIYPDNVSYGLSREPGKPLLFETSGVVGVDGLIEKGRRDHHPLGHRSGAARGSHFLALEQRLGPARMLRLDPDQLRLPSEIITRTQTVDFWNEHGLGLPGVYDAILNQDFEAFAGILAEVRKLFPSVRKVGLANIGGAKKTLEVTLASGQQVGPEYMSEGLLYYLAFAALRFLAPASVVLIEEPENGLHPARIGDVMRVLREVSKTTQILLATHSPLVINEMQPDEVSIVTRTEAEGTKLTLMKDTTNFEKRSSAYALGELWLSFADGESESRLVPALAQAAS